MEQTPNIFSRGSCLINGTSSPHGTSPFHVEDVELGYATPDMRTKGVKSDRLWWDQEERDTSEEDDNPGDRRGRVTKEAKGREGLETLKTPALAPLHL